MLNKRQEKASDDFSAAVNAEAVLDDKTRHMVKLAAAMALGCYPWMESLLGGAKEKGVSRDETGAVLLTVMMVAAGAVQNKCQEVFETRVNKG